VLYALSPFINLGSVNFMFVGILFMFATIGPYEMFGNCILLAILFSL